MLLAKAKKCATVNLQSSSGVANPSAIKINENVSKILFTCNLTFLVRGYIKAFYSHLFGL